MRETKRMWVLKFWSVPMLVMFLVFGMSMNVNAASDGAGSETLDLSEYILQVGGLGGSNVSGTEDGEYTLDESWLASGTEDVENTIYNGLKNKTSCIDLSSYGLSTSNFSTIFYKVVNKHPELFYVTGRVTYYSSGGYVTQIYPGYDSSYSDAEVAAFNQKVDQIIAGVDSSWPDIEKILYLHDYMVTNIEYDQTYSKYNAYNALMEGSCVCQGYSLAYLCLLNEVNVDVELVTSNELNHAWNLVELDGEYFYTDVTWDDPVGPGETFCRHNNFMVDKAGLIDAGHDSTDWIGKNSGSNIYNLATSSRYMDYFWKDMTTAVPLIGTKAGYLSDGKLNVYDFANGTTNSYDRNVAEWKVWGKNNSSWIGDFCSMAATAGAFYYTTPQDIYRMDLNGNSTKVYTLSASEAALGYIYGLKAAGNTLTYILQTEPQGDATYTGTYSFITPIEQFVTRMYQQCLSRDPDQAGLEGWVSQLEKGYMNGADIAQQFIFSKEMLDKNLSDAEFVGVLYKAMMGREADEAGKAGWVSQLSNGNMTRMEVTKSFVESIEFADICTEYGIIQGDYDASSAMIERFVARFYSLCLERSADQSGLYGWVSNLKNQNMNGADIVNAFFFGEEFTDKNISNDKFVELLYNTLMGRASDEGGKAGWVSQLNKGNMTRSEVTKSFVEFKEFTDICNNYGINRGSFDSTTAPIERFVIRFYSLCLERDADQSGMYGWVRNLKNQHMNGAQIADAFFFGKEFTDKNVSDEKYIELLYSTLLGREADEQGKNGWVYQMDQKYMSRRDVLKAFIESVEFTNICESYGIIRGSLE